MSDPSGTGSPHDVLGELARAIRDDLQGQGYEVDVVVSTLADEEGLLDCLFFPGMPDESPMYRDSGDGKFVLAKWAAVQEAAEQRAPIGMKAAWRSALVDGVGGYTLVMEPDGG